MTTENQQSPMPRVMGQKKRLGESEECRLDMLTFCERDMKT